MINDDRSTRSDRGSMPSVRTMRLGTSGLGLVLLVAGVAFLTAGVGAGHGGVHALNLGLTLACLSGMCGIVVAGTLIGEQVARLDSARVHALRDEIRALRHEIRHRLEAVETGEQVIADSVQQLGGDDEAPDELVPRRHGR